jgi:hypothetical protein
LYTEVKSAPFANEQHHASKPIRESSDAAGMENGERHASAFDRGDRAGGLDRPKKKGQPVAAPFMNGMKLLNMMVISMFPSNFSRAPSSSSGRPSSKFCIDWLFAAIGRMP